MVSAASRSSLHGPAGILRCVERCCPSAAQARRSETCMTSLGPARYRRGDARGLEVSPGSLLQNELVQRQVRDRPAQTAILLLELLQALDLVVAAPAAACRHRYGDLGVAIWRIRAERMFSWPCERILPAQVRTISSGVYLFFGIAVLLHVKKTISDALLRGRATAGAKSNGLAHRKAKPGPRPTGGLQHDVWHRVRQSVDRTVGQFNLL